MQTPDRHVSPGRRLWWHVAILVPSLNGYWAFAALLYYSLLASSSVCGLNTLALMIKLYLLQ